MEQNFETCLYNVVDAAKVQKDEPMKKHTTFRIGGPADYFIMPSNEKELAETIRVCREFSIPIYIVGNGSNLLVGDKGFRGAIIQLYKSMGTFQVEGNQITAQAGCSLAQIANAALDAALTGFEFAAGIPGTLGGAVVMNAGAYGGEMKDVLKDVTVMTGEGEVRVIPAAKLEMGYRTSIIKKAGYLVLGATISLKEGNLEEIKTLTRELREKRTSKQPLEFPSAGSTFKRPEGYFAGKLIMDSGLRGCQIGGARVSDKHCGFVINAGDATAEDVVSLMKHVTEVVREKYGVTLEPEVKFLGEFDKKCDW